MEKRLAEFRDPRKAENPNKRVETTAYELPDTQTAVDTNSVLIHEWAPRKTLTEANTTSPQIGTTQDTSDWLLDSALRRWMGSSRLAFTNITVLKVLLWLVLLGLFAELEFGLPFFLISLFYWMYQGFRSPGARQPGELSAYSVFNPDCQPILGSITPAQLDGEMCYIAMAHI
ncbi:hypothetical protein NHX12_026379 [Muraenolepis orangiensis]|uniref:SAYSvFN domain-containing protein n=1 Tax=Muraenolepis orangiensis TaxID=630683 RepID=A0A9Q0EHD8_9TELE|nr:hypothetical protein NHX12_026379 [Muraenolepis orangiensis]